ncbi:MAG TPA: TIGR04551 family protein, partial [Kofleriaceae bacterium]|nr:TIGR04551 family protein [Kofleriaceae bacterium]
SGLYNLDLDRGLDSTGQPLFTVPLSGGQFLDAGDLRARTDLALYARGVGVAVKARIDWLDNVAIGGSPDLAGGSPATSGGQRPTTVVVKRAWGEALTPAGTLAVGRMGAHFGMGMAANGGDCEDCDHGDAADRLAFVTPLFGHLVAVAHDFASRGPFTPGRDGGHPVELEASTAASGPTFGVLKVHSPATLARRADAGLTSVEYAGYVTHRAQENDVPATYLPTATPPSMYTSTDLVARGFSATGTGAWLRITSSRFRLEAEVAYAKARVAQPSLIPGTEITVPVTSNQLGAAMQSDVIAGPTRLGFDAGYASGDSAPGFGAFPKAGQTSPMAGAFDGPQADLPRDRTVDNFRFHPDYRVDQILFREIIGTVTDAIYVRPHVRATLMTVGSGKLETVAAVIASWAVEPTSTPSGQRPLGVELDPELRYAHKDGFAINFAYGLLFPGAAFDGTTLPAKPAQCFRLRMGFAF